MVETCEPGGVWVQNREGWGFAGHTRYYGRIGQCLRTDEIIATSENSVIKWRTARKPAYQLAPNGFAALRLEHGLPAGETRVKSTKPRIRRETARQNLRQSRHHHRPVGGKKLLQKRRNGSPSASVRNSPQTSVANLRLAGSPRTVAPRPR